MILVNNSLVYTVDNIKYVFEKSVALEMKEMVDTLPENDLYLLITKAAHDGLGELELKEGFKIFYLDNMKAIYKAFKELNYSSPPTYSNTLIGMLLEIIRRNLNERGKRSSC